jgi:transposase
MSGRPISPLTAAALCVKPRGHMTPRQIVNVDVLKAASAEFTTMRQLAMRFRGLLHGGTVEKLDAWLSDARHYGIYGMRRFATTLRQDIAAVRNAVLEPWSNGPDFEPRANVLTGKRNRQPATRRLDQRPRLRTRR